MCGPPSSSSSCWTELILAWKHLPAAADSSATMTCFVTQSWHLYGFSTSQGLVSSPLLCPQNTPRSVYSLNSEPSTSKVVFFDWVMSGNVAKLSSFYVISLANSQTCSHSLLGYIAIIVNKSVVRDKERWKTLYEHPKFQMFMCKHASVVHKQQQFFEMFHATEQLHLTLFIHLLPLFWCSGCNDTLLIWMLIPMATIADRSNRIIPKQFFKSYI